MKVQYIATIAITAILGLVTANISNANSNVLTRSNSITISSQVAQSNPCAGKPNPCAGKANPCAGKANPCAGKANPCAGKANPCAGKPSASTTRHPQFYTENGTALDGQDVVAYFTQSKLVAGMPQFKHTWGGTTWLFSSVANRDLFAQNPGKYAPQYGGYCAQAASEGNLATTKPDVWKIVNGKLYLNYDKTVQTQWISDIPGHIASANKNWPGILNNNDLFR